MADGFLSGLPQSFWEDLKKQKQEAEQKRVADLAAQGKNPDGSPMRPEFDYEGDKTRLGDWEQLMQEQIGQQGVSNIDTIARQGAQSRAQAMDQLAMRGGASGGAGERMARAGSWDEMVGRQGARRGSQQDLLNLSLKKQEMGQGLEEKKRADDLEKYKIGMETWAANKQADAQARAAGGGGGMCFITTAICETLGLPDDNPILNTFRKFRDEQLGGKQAVQEYYEVAPKIIARIKELGAEDTYYEILSIWLIPALQAIHNKDYRLAEEIYTEMVCNLKDIFLKSEKGVA